MFNKIAIILLTFFVLINSASGQAGNQEEKLLSTAELKSDLRYLKNKLETYHPGLYLYTKKAQIDELFDSLENSLSKPFTELAFYKHITIISSIIKDGHTIILPGAATTVYHNKNSVFLPYHFGIVNNQLYVDMVYTNDPSIAEGSEIISINSINSKEIMRQLTDRQIRDGNNLTYPAWILSNYFREYYSYIFGHAETNEITYKINGHKSTTAIKALPKDSIYYYRQKFYPGKTFSNLPNDGIKLQIKKDNHCAILTIKDFHNSVLRKEFKQKFNRVIAACFEEIDNSETENLIIDLRNNQGGDIENGVFLLSYLFDKPFSVVQDYFCVKNYELQHCSGPALGMHDPKSNSFKGPVYVLINGGSFSNSGIVSSCLQNNGRAIFIGQETGGNPHVIAGFIKDISLPNTKIKIQIPTKQFIITDKLKNTGKGIMPTHIITPTLKDMLEGMDTELNFTVDLINRAIKGR